MRKCFDMLKANKHRLTVQQYKTLKGQILAGDLDGFRKGLSTIKDRM